MEHDWNLHLVYNDFVSQPTLCRPLLIFIDFRKILLVADFHHHHAKFVHYWTWDSLAPLCCLLGWLDDAFQIIKLLHYVCLFVSSTREPCRLYYHLIESITLLLLNTVLRWMSLLKLHHGCAVYARSRAYSTSYSATRGHYRAYSYLPRKTNSRGIAGAVGAGH